MLQLGRQLEQRGPTNGCVCRAACPGMRVHLINERRMTPCSFAGFMAGWSLTQFQACLPMPPSWLDRRGDHSESFKAGRELRSVAGAAIFGRDGLLLVAWRGQRTRADSPQHHCGRRTIFHPN